jgi:hypothetical protein
LGQLARKLSRGQKKSSAIPLAIPLNVVVRQVTCGALHTAVVTEGGYVYTWGDAKYGKLGQSKEVLEHDTKTPQMVEALNRVFIVAVACGRHHTVALSADGDVYSWGWGKAGQLGHGNRYDQPLPVKIDPRYSRADAAHTTGPVLLVACGDKHTVVVNRAELRAFSFGCGEHGQTGHGKPENQFDPTPIEALKDKQIIGLSCGPIHTGFVTRTVTIDRSPLRSAQSHVAVLLMVSIVCSIRCEWLRARAGEGQVYMCGFGEFFYSSASTQLAARGGAGAGAGGGAAGGGADDDSKSVASAATPAPGAGPGASPSSNVLMPGAAGGAAGGAGGAAGGSPDALMRRSLSKTALAAASGASAAADNGAGAGGLPPPAASDRSGLSSPKHKSRKHINGAAHLQLLLSSSANGSATNHTHFAYLPRLIVFPSDAAPIVQIACGQNHNLALSRTYSSSNTGHIAGQQHRPAACYLTD